MGYLGDYGFDPNYKAPQAGINDFARVAKCRFADEQLKWSDHSKVSEMEKEMEHEMEFGIL